MATNYTIFANGLRNYTSTLYPNGVSFEQIRNDIISLTGFSPNEPTEEYVLSVSPQIGFGVEGVHQQRIYSVSLTWNDPVDGPTTNFGNILDFEVSYFYYETNPDTTPPVVLYRQGDNVTFQLNTITTQTRFANTFFNYFDNESGIFQISFDPVLNLTTTGTRTTRLTVINNTGLVTYADITYTITPSITVVAPRITGPNSLTVYTDEGLTNTLFVQRYMTVTVGSFPISGYRVRIGGLNVNWTRARAQAVAIVRVTDTQGNFDEHELLLTVAVRPPFDSEAPQVTQLESTIIYFYSAYQMGVLASQITADIRASFEVTDANEFAMSVGPAVTDFTEVGSRTYIVQFTDSLGNQSLQYTIVVNYLNDGDIIPPTISGPASLTFRASENKTQFDVIANYTLTDNLDANPFWFNISSVTFNTIGVFSYLLRAKDVSGNVGTRTVTINVVADNVEIDVTPPIVAGPTYLRYREADEFTLGDLLLLYTVTDNVSARADIEFLATIAGTSIPQSYQFPIGVTNLVLRFYDEADNYSIPVNVIIDILDDDEVLEIGEQSDKLEALIDNFKYSGPIVSTLVDDEWQPISWLVDPIQVNYTIDGLSDEININFLSRVKDTKLNSGDLIRVVYDSTSQNREVWGLPSYDLRKRPDNHDIMVVSSGQMVKLNGQDIYRHNYKLVELIEVLKDYRLPTLTYTSFATAIQYDISGDPSLTETYYARPYNALTILQRAIKLAFPSTSTELNPIRNLILIQDTSILENEMVNSDHQFEEPTLYDVVTEIARIVGRTPVLYLNPDFGESNPSKYLLFFERDNEHTVAIVDKVNLLANTSEVVESVIPDKGATQIVVDAKNMIGSQVTIYPSNDMYGFAQSVNDEELETKGDKPLKIILPYNISSVELIRFKKFSVVTQDDDFDITLVGGNIPIEGVLPVYKYNDWLVLESDQRENSAYYNEGENEIFFGKGVDDGTNDWENFFTSDSYVETIVSGEETVYGYILFQVEYYPLIDLQTRLGDGKQGTFNQLNPMQDSETLGNEVFNYIKGNETGDITVSKLETSYKNILKPTQLVNWDGDLYHITSTSFNSTKTNKGEPNVLYKVAYQLNKKVRRNANLNASTEQRAYQVAYENTFDRFNVIKEKVKLHFTTNVREDDDPIFSTLNYLFNNTNESTGYRYILGAIVSGSIYQTIELVAFSTFSNIFDNEALTTSESFIKYILAQPVKTLFGNSVLINFKMHDNTYAGTKILIGDGGASSFDFQQRRVNYTDPFGKVQSLLDIVYIWQDAANFADIKNFVENYPQIQSLEKFDEMTPSNKTIARVRTYEIDKDTRENLNITLQVEYEGTNGTRIGTEIVKYSNLYQTRPYTTIPFKIVTLNSPYGYEPDDVINLSNVVGEVIPVTQVSPLYNIGYQIILDDDDYTFNTTSPYALVEQISTGVFKILAIMGDRSSTVVTDTLFIYY